MSGTTHRDDVLTSLTDGIAALTTSHRWQEWLTAQSRFHHYSFNNVILIHRQNPEATRIAGFNAWKKLDRAVRKGEKAIWILAPMVYKKDDAEAGTEERQVRGFKAVPVFDIAQTDGEPLPEVCSRLHGDAPAGYDQLVEVAHSIGYTVEEDYLPGETNGDCTYDKKRIRVEARNDAVQQLKTLAHELAHAMLHEGFANRALAELEAESVAYVVCAALGVDSSDYSFGYVAGWSGGGDEAITAIKASGSRIQTTADRILVGLNQEDHEEVAA